MKITNEETAQQRRQRGFWAKLRDPKTLAIVFWCVKWIVRAIQLYYKLSGEGGSND